MKNYTGYQSESPAKRRENSITGRISSKKDKTMTDWYNLATETGKYEKSQQKARKKALKSTNDAELVRRGGLYAPTKHASSTPNPNLAFRRKKGVKAYEPSFYIPARFQKTYDTMLDDGVSKQRAQKIIKGFIVNEQEQPPKNHAVEVDTEAKPDRKAYNYMGIDPSTKKELVRSKVRSKVWSEVPGRWEYEDEHERNEDPP